MRGGGAAHRPPQRLAASLFSGCWLSSNYACLSTAYERLQINPNFLVAQQWPLASFLLSLRTDTASSALEEHLRLVTEGGTFRDICVDLSLQKP